MGISMDIIHAYTCIYGYIHGYTHGLPIACLWLTCKIATTTSIPQSTTGGWASYQNDHDAGIPF